ncbi:hypothetical protein HNQ07_004175 [Deinococcus metalli]|uniref:Transposase n=1 Tax=Deinococcus metalli TaxID=1141878 RepID=A0A7W8KK37_9DEIO|nr:hypothetical protein [Deinococcus metalli]GHF61553.1 hypothetical protein GCM10017781_42150 [Deinococcus metalli]
MSKSQIPGERVRILADEFLAIPTTSYQQRSLQAALFMFLNTSTKTALHRADLVSKSALSRLLNEYKWDTTEGWAVLQRAQWDVLHLAARRKHRPLLRLSVDLTSIEKKGSMLPFVRVYNKVHGIHLVVLFAEYGAVKFPVGYRVYKGKGTATPVTLARELLRTVPDAIKRRFRVRVLADSGFEAAVFLDEVRQFPECPRTGTLPRTSLFCWMNRRGIYDPDSASPPRPQRGHLRRSKPGPGRGLMLEPLRGGPARRGHAPNGSRCSGWL